MYSGFIASEGGGSGGGGGGGGGPGGGSSGATDQETFGLVAFSLSLESKTESVK